MTAGELKAAARAAGFTNPGAVGAYKRGYESAEFGDARSAPYAGKGKSLDRASLAGYDAARKAAAA